jgi:hypothetical protein
LHRAILPSPAPGRAQNNATLNNYSKRFNGSCGHHENSVNCAPSIVFIKMLSIATRKPTRSGAVYFNLLIK